MCTQSTTYTTTTSSTVGYTAMTSSGNEIHLTVKNAEMSNVDMVGLVHEISNSTYTSCNCLTGTNDWEIKASTWVGGLRANNNNFTLAIVDGTGNVLATQSAQTNGNITALTYLSVKATGLGTGPYYAVISYNKNSGSGDGFLNMHGWTLRIREDVPTTEAVVESNAFSYQPSYRYGFNGMERDDEVKGSGNSYDFGARIYDPRLGRWLSIDPVRKEYESPYASFANNPVYVIDPDGKDSLIVHRSGPVAEMSKGDADISIVTFSVIRNGVETTIPGRMYMYGDKEANKRGDNSLTAKETYKLSWDQLSNHNGDENWENTIRITNIGNFFHPGTGIQDFEGCYGLSCDEPSSLQIGDKTYNSIEWEGSIESLQQVRDMYNMADGGENGGKLTGDKFILKNNSEAPRQNIEKMKTKTIDRIPTSTDETGS